MNKAEAVKLLRDCADHLNDNQSVDVEYKVGLSLVADFLESIKESKPSPHDNLRKCKGRTTVYEGGKWITKEFELGYFHQWGLSYEEFENGVGNYTVAIVELPDGSIVTPSANDIMFYDEGNMEK